MTPIRTSIRQRLAVLSAAAVVMALAAGPSAAGALPKNVIMHEAAKPVPAISFENGQGQMRSLADLKGKVVLLNVWATWCVSCRQEMPALDRLQAAFGKDDFAIVPLSIDRGGKDAVAKFYADTGVNNLATDVDVSGKSLRALDAVGLPTTLIIDRAGQEVGRVVGPLQWDAPEVVELLRSIVARPAGAAAIAQDAPAYDAPPHRGLLNSLANGTRWLKALLNR